MTLEQALKTQNLLFDGAMDSYLQKSGIAPGLNTAACNLSHPEIIRGVHAAYILAGADIITAASEGADGITLKAEGAERSSYDICCAAAQNAKAGGGNAFTLMALGPIDRPDADLDELYNAYEPQIKAAADCKLDGIILQGMNNLFQARAAYLAARDNCSLPVIACFEMENGRLLDGTPAAVAASIFQAMGADALGLNCSESPLSLLSALRDFKDSSSLPILIRPNAIKDGAKMEPEEFRESLKALVDAGAVHIGGRRGSTPEHIRSLASITPPGNIKNELDRPYMLADSRKLYQINYQLNKPFAPSASQSAGLICSQAIQTADSGDFYIDISLLDEKTISQLMSLLEKRLHRPLIIKAASPEQYKLALKYYCGIAGVTGCDFETFHALSHYGPVLI